MPVAASATARAASPPSWEPHSGQKTTPARACINDSEVERHEREFKSDYLKQPGNPVPATDEPSSPSGGEWRILAASVLGLGRLVRPARPSKSKLTTYESGVDPVGSAFNQSQVRYYIFALLFVLFDVEAVFIFPWAMGLETYSVFGLVEMGVFVVILVLGLVYAWRKGVLRWV